LSHNNYCEVSQVASFGGILRAHEDSHSPEDSHLAFFVFIRRICVFFTKVATNRVNGGQKQLPLKLRGTYRPPTICRECNQVAPVSFTGCCWECDGRREGSLLTRTPNRSGENYNAVQAAERSTCRTWGRPPFA
jgi:hypothetical protein